MARCFECKKPATHNHHVIPQSLGGTRTVPLCDYCHPKAHGENGYWAVRDLIKAKLHARRAQGYRVGGQLPYGKMADADKRIVDNPQERYWQYVAKALHDMGIHFKAIAQMFNARGVPNKTRRGKWVGWKVNTAVKRLREELGEPHEPGVWVRGVKKRP
jgi:hypothetical protein